MLKIQQPVSTSTGTLALKCRNFTIILLEITSENKSKGGGNQSEIDIQCVHQSNTR